MGIFDIFKPNIEKMKGQKNIKGLLKAFRHRDYYIRETAAQALGVIGDPIALEPLVKALGDAMVASAVALGKLKDPRAVEPLIAVLMEERMHADQTCDSTQIGNDIVRSVVIALGKIGDQHALKSLKGVLSSLKPKPEEFSLSPRIVSGHFGPSGDITGPKFRYITGPNVIGINVSSTNVRGGM